MLQRPQDITMLIASRKCSRSFRRLFIAALCLLSLADFTAVHKTSYYRTETSANTPVPTGPTARPDETNSTAPSPLDTKVAVVKACIGTSFKRISEPSLNNARNYAKRHSYTFLELNESTYPETTFFTPPSWVKVAYLHDLLERGVPYDWLVWFDCDTLVLRQHFALELILQELNVSEDHHFVLTEDDPNNSEIALFNAGIFFMRNSDWNREELGRVLRLASNAGIRNHGLWEQEALRFLYTENKFMEHERMLVVSARWKFNAFDRLGEETNETVVWHRTACRTQPECDDKFKRKAEMIEGSD